MPLNTQSPNLILPPKVEEELVVKVSGGSALQKAARRVILPGSGLTTQALTNTDAQFVGEGAKKPVVENAFTQTTMNPYKIAKIVPLTKELKDDKPAIMNAIQVESVDSLGRTFDKAGTGNLSTPVPAGFSVLTTADSVEISNYTTLIAALGAVESNGGEASAFVLSKPMIRKLQGLVDGFGRQLLNISDSDIQGIPYYTYKSTKAEGFVGDFAGDARWGIVPGSFEVSISEHASITINGELVSLWEQNMVGVRVEGRYGFSIGNIQNFRKITVPDATPAGS